MLFLITKKPKTKFAQGLATAYAVIEAATPAQALRLAKPIPIFKVDYPGEYCAPTAKIVTDGATGYF